MGAAQEGLLDKLRAANTPANFAPKRIKTAPCQQVVRLGADIDLAKLPFVRAWSGDRQTVINGAQSTPAMRPREYGVQQDTIIDSKHLSLHFEPTSELAQAVPAWKDRAERMPLALTFSGDAAAQIAALLPIPVGIDATLVVGALRNTPLEVPNAAATTWKYQPTRSQQSRDSSIRIAC